MRAQSNRKNKKVWKKKPKGLGWPTPSAMSKKRPNTLCVTRYVSGLAITKKTRAEYIAYFAFKATFGI